MSSRRTPRYVLVVAFSAASAIVLALAILFYTHGMQFGAGRQVQITAGDPKIFLLMFIVLGLVLLGLAFWLAIRDLKEREKSRLALESAETKYLRLFENAPVGVFQSTPDGRLLSANPALARIFGYDSPEEMVASRVDLARQSFLRPEDRDRFVRDLTEKGELLNLERQALRKDGSTIWVREDVRCVRDGDGHPCLFEGMLIDITLQVMAEKALRESEEKYRLLFQANPQPTWVYDLDSLKFLAVNEAAVETYGYSRQELLQMTLQDIRPPEDIPQLLEAAKDHNVVAKGSIFRHRKKDGTVFEVEITEDRILFEGRREAGLVVAVDISQRVALEDQLRQIQKMEALGQLAGGVAHDFNNILMVVLSYCDLLLERKWDDKSGEYVGRIQKAAKRATGITKQLLAFSRRQALNPQRIDTNEVIGKDLEILQQLLGAHVRVIFLPGDNLAAIHADPTQIEQVIMNLAVNARDAMPHGGDLIIETANVDLDEHYATTHYPVEPGRYVMLTVSDTGEGMDPETQRKAFDPFFTTKPQGKGTGLGLATVYGIVKQSGGHIWVYSERHRGTVFKIYFPQVVAEAERAEAPVAEPSRRRTGTILLVEDEESLAQAEADYLESLGYVVLLAHSGRDAVKMTEQHAGEVDLVVTDVVLPGMSGKDLAEMVRKERPKTQVLYMSGYATNTSMLTEIQAGEPFLQKPFTLSMLGRTIETMLKARVERRPEAGAA